MDLELFFCCSTTSQYSPKNGLKRTSGTTRARKPSPLCSFNNSNRAINIRILSQGAYESFLTEKNGNIGKGK